MRRHIDVVYVISSKLGSIGIGSIAYNALRGIENSRLTYKGFCRGYNNEVVLDKKNLKNYGFLEYLSYPFRYLHKKMGLKINSRKFVNSIFGKLIYKKLPECKIYHTWINIAPQAILKAKKNNSVLILEGANSHPLNVVQIMNEEYKKYNLTDYLVNEKKVKKESEIYNLFDYVMCPSDFVYNSFLKQGFSKEKLIKMPYGVDTNKFKPEKNKEKQKKDKKFRAIFVGSLQLRKGVQYLLQAWGELNLKNAELILVGRVWPDAKKIIKKYKNDSTIKFIGFNPNPSKFLRMGDVFVSPSLEEGSALTCYEAMACGLPLIATYNTGSVARNGKDGFIISAGKKEVLKEKILYFYNNPKDIKKMGENARKRVEKYSWDTYMKNLVKVYKKILKKWKNKN